MPKALVVLLCLLIAMGPVAADEKNPPPEEPAKPLTAGQAADKVLAAVDAKDEDALASLAGRDEPDPWLVADELCARGRVDAAAAFAKASPRRMTRGLPAYLDTIRSGGGPGEAERKRLTELTAALRARKPEDVLQAPEPKHDSVVAMRLRLLRGNALRALERLPDAVAEFMKAGEIANRLDWMGGALHAYERAGYFAFHAQDFRAAETAFERVVTELGAEADPRLISPLSNLALAQTRLGKLTEALAARERLLAVSRRLGSAAGVAAARGGLGGLHWRLGNYDEALEHHHAVLAHHRKAGDERQIAFTLYNIALVHQSRAEYARAQSRFEEALALLRRVGNPSSIAQAIGGVGNTAFYLGDLDGAIAHHLEALTLVEGTPDKRGTAAVLANLGLAYERKGDLDKALHYQQRALVLMEQTQSRTGIARALTNIASVHMQAGRPEEALPLQRRACGIFEGLGAREELARLYGNIANTHLTAGRSLKAKEWHEKSLRLGDQLQSAEVEVLSRTGLAWIELGLGRPAEAMAHAKLAIAALDFVVRGLAEGEGADVRDRFQWPYEVGVHAALAAGDDEALCFFLESGRAGLLLESLGGRAALRDYTLPADLRELAKRVREMERDAFRNHRAALARGRMEETRSRREALKEAREAVQGVFGRIQREAKAAADLYAPGLASLTGIRSRLRPDETLVLYALLWDRVVALVVERGRARTVHLGAPAPILEACTTLLEPEVERDDAAAVARLRGLVVEPLGLMTARVLISPQGLLSYMPFSLLVGERAVAYVPSATTFGLLRDASGGRGEGVLALGDPVYKGTRLSPLPATRVEAKRLGTTTLLGAEATVPKLRAALAKQSRWRAVHLACHGLVDVDRPLLSSLALSPDAHGANRLQCLDVFALRVQTDLAVLSACETAKGRIYKTEGIVGLTRAFMFAGAPRVICSLWKVDDEATLALMSRFYALWSPKDASSGLGTAAALRKAQEHVRDHPDHPEWKHPYYWAAWVLWGVPD